MARIHVIDSAPLIGFRTILTQPCSRLHKFGRLTQLKTPLNRGLPEEFLRLLAEFEIYISPLGYLNSFIAIMGRVARMVTNLSVGLWAAGSCPRYHPMQVH
jgi:hypothetical protein